MIEINLLPDEIKKTRQRLKKIDISKIDVKNIQVLNISSAIFGTIIVIQIILFFIGIYSKHLLNSYATGYKGVSPKKEAADILKSQVGTINRKIAAIDELMVKRFSWAKKLNELSDAMTPGIWLTELSYNEKFTEKTVPVDPKILKGRPQGLTSPKPVTEKIISRYLIISGLASSMGEEGTALIGKLIKSLKDDPAFYSDFSTIELGVIKRDRLEDQEVMSFKITCLFKEQK